MIQRRTPSSSFRRAAFPLLQLNPIKSLLSIPALRRPRIVPAKAGYQACGCSKQKERMDTGVEVEHRGCPYLFIPVYLRRPGSLGILWYVGFHQRSQKTSIISQKIKIGRQTSLNDLNPTFNQPSPNKTHHFCLNSPIFAHFLNRFS